MEDKLFKIHSTRFFNVEPKAITSMCYENHKLALSRSDNRIEIWNIEHTPHIEKIIPGTVEDSIEGSIEALAWSKGRLFSTGLHGYIIEYDLIALTPKASYTAHSGSAWCLAINKQQTLLAVGTEEGCVSLFEIHEEKLEFSRLFDKQEGRIFSLSWHSSGDFIVTGSSDAIRVWNVKTGHAVNRLSPGRVERNKETTVWCVAITDDFVIISGDSRGTTSFWDGKIGTLLEEVNAHKAAVLCLCLSEDQQTVYSAGVDPVIVLFARVTLAGGRRQWIRSVQRAIHTHDVQSILLAGPKLISGGVDTYLSISSYPPKTLNRYPPLPQTPCVQLAAEKRLLLLSYPYSLDVWQLGAAVKSTNSQQLAANSFLKLSQEPAHLLQLQAKDYEWIVCSAISSDGQYLAYSTESVVRLYQVTLGNGAPKLQKRFMPDEVGCCHRMLFVGRDKLLLVTAKQTMQLFDLSSSSEIKAVHTFCPEQKFQFEDSIHLMDASADGRFAVVADHQSKIVVVDLKSLELHSVLPRYKSHPTALAFHPNSKLIVVAYSDHKIVEYDVECKQFTTFSRKLSSKLPTQWLNRSSTVRHVTFDPRHPDVIILHDDSVICTINKNQDFAEPDTKITKFDAEDSQDAPNHLAASPTRHSRTVISGNSSFTMSKRYKHLAYFASVDSAEMVAVEVSPISLEKHLPPALYKKRFGV